jgi:hypothetical protein
VLRQLEAAALQVEHRKGQAFQHFLDADLRRAWKRP